MSSQKSGKGKVVGDPTTGRGRKIKGRFIRGGSIQIEVDRHRRGPATGSDQPASVQRTSRPRQQTVPRPSSPTGITMIPTPGFQPSQYSDEHPSHRSFDQHYEGRSSRSVHLDESVADDEVHPYVAELERDEEVAEEMAEEAALAADPRGELARYVRAVPRHQWPRDSNGKYYLECMNKG